MSDDPACQGWTATFEPPSLGGGVVEHLLAALVAMDVDYLLAHPHPRTPRIYEAGLRYEHDERWSTIPAVLARGYADCKSLAAWRAAELRIAGEPALAVWSDWSRPGRCFFHVQVLRGDGSLEDPSTLLGMRL